MLPPSLYSSVPERRFQLAGQDESLGAILSSLASAVFVPLSAVFCRFLECQSPRKREQDDHHESTDDR